MKGPELRFRPSPATEGLLRRLAWIGGGAAAVGLCAAWSGTWAMVFLAGYFALQVGLAAAVFIAIQCVTGAGWGVALRRIPEALTALIPAGGLLVLVPLFLCPELHPWRTGGHELHGHFKPFWLSGPFFLARSVGYVLLWTALARGLVAVSRRQDFDASPAHTAGLTMRSAAFLVVFGLSYSLASFDWIMSREPEWSSTMFGVYQFSGLFTAGLAAILVSAILLWRAGVFRGIFLDHHQHDLGKLLFGMASFWFYIWFCQYMLIWYVNNPEETSHYVVRQQGVLGPLFYLNVVLNWAVPFFFLLPREAKRRRKILLNVSLAVLAGHALDLGLAFLPEVQGAFGWLGAAGVAAGAAGLFIGIFRRSLAQANLVPVHDPYLIESLTQASASHGDGSEN